CGWRWSGASGSWELPRNFPRSGSTRRRGAKSSRSIAAASASVADCTHDSPRSHLTRAGGSKPVSPPATVSVWSPYVAQALRLDLAKGRQPRCRVLVGRHRFHRKLHILGAGGRTFRANGAGSPEASISLCVGRDVGFDGGRNCRLLPGTLRL